VLFHTCPLLSRRFLGGRKEEKKKRIRSKIRKGLSTCYSILYYCILYFVNQVSGVLMLNSPILSNRLQFALPQIVPLRS
jgi:hypothetical protein